MNNETIWQTLKRIRKEPMPDEKKKDLEKRRNALLAPWRKELSISDKEPQPKKP